MNIVKSQSNPRIWVKFDCARLLSIDHPLCSIMFDWLSILFNYVRLILESIGLERRSNILLIWKSNVTQTQSNMEITVTFDWNSISFDNRVSIIQLGLIVFSWFRVGFVWLTWNGCNRLRFDCVQQKCKLDTRPKPDL